MSGEGRAAAFELTNPNLPYTTHVRYCESSFVVLYDVYGTAVVLQMKQISTWIETILTHLTTRWIMHVKCKQPYVAQEVILQVLVLTLTSPASPGS